MNVSQLNKSTPPPPHLSLSLRSLSPSPSPPPPPPPSPSPSLSLTHSLIQSLSLSLSLTLFSLSSLLSPLSPLSLYIAIPSLTCWTEAAIFGASDKSTDNQQQEFIHLRLGLSSTSTIYGVISISYRNLVHRENIWPHLLSVVDYIRDTISITLKYYYPTIMIYNLTHKPQGGVAMAAWALAVKMLSAEGPRS